MSQWIDFKQLRESLDFAQVLTHFGVEPKLRGDQHHGFCPLPTHQGKKNSPSFSANLTKKIFHCFGCQAKGNIIDFAARMSGLDPTKGEDVKKAARMLAEQLGGSRAKDRKLEAPSHSVVPAKPTTTPKVLINEPLDFDLKQLQADHPYLLSRGFTPSTIAHFGLGFCTRGYLEQRVAIPLHDNESRLIGYAGRLVDDTLVGPNNPKYLLPSARERKGVMHEFKKSLFLYNGDKIPGPVDLLIVVEGFPSLWWLHQAGIINVVSTMGASCSDEQAKIIVEKVTPAGTIWIFSDGNDAGRRHATEVLLKVSSHRAVRLLPSPEGKQPTDYTAVELKGFFTAKRPEVQHVENDSASIKQRIGSGQTNIREAIIELANSLPCLASLRIMQETWNPDEFDKMSGKLSSGERAALQFLLHVWNPFQKWNCGSFDIGALDTWDRTHRQVFAAWATDPWWC